MSSTNASSNFDGWLINPEGSSCYRFYRDSESVQKMPFVLIDKWSPDRNGVPSFFQNRYELPLEEALEMCGNMLLDGWKKLEIQFADSIEPMKGQINA